MAILYYVKVTNPNNVDLFPPSLASYQTTLIETLADAPGFASVEGSSAYLFSDMSALTSVTSAVALSGANLAAMNEWKTANNITIEYSILGLSATADTPPNLFGD